MLALTAQYADMWNSAYYGTPDTFQEPLQQIQAACQENGRAIDSLDITATLAIAFPDLGDTSRFMPIALKGTVEEVAEVMKQYDELGVTHLIFHCAPYGQAAMERLAQSITLYRQMVDK
jgi:alkanesulfonate monooxygenase SsuD/methylene tetrahydromethanopterin reductase-like flavin-dependent oxidoreductase (luciferase family)